MDRFWSKVDKTPGQGPKGDCWAWTGYRNEQGYGRMGSPEGGGKLIKATHMALELAGKPRPGAAHALHSCDWPPCVREDHLSWGDQQRNTDEMWQRGKANPAKGEQIGVSKLDAAKVLEIRASPKGNLDLSRVYGVSTTTIKCVRKRTTWKHIEEQSTCA